MNNKGQTLVVFVILLPLLFILISFIVDNGFLALEKEKINNVVKDAINDCLKNNKSIEELTILINKNIDDIKIKNISDDNGIWYLRVTKEFNGIIFKKNYSIDLSFKAYLENNKIIIKKE